MSETERERVADIVETAIRRVLNDEDSVEGQAIWAEREVRRLLAPTSDEAQGIEVVAEGHAQQTHLNVYGRGYAGHLTIARLGHEDAQRRGATPALIVRDTPEAREALGMDEND